MEPDTRTDPAAGRDPATVDATAAAADLAYLRQPQLLRDGRADELVRRLSGTV